MVLIVDDKAENIFSLQRTLELQGFEVDSATSGEEALKKILKYAYSLIILDVQMPGMDGFEVAEALSGYSKAKDIPIIFLSAVNTHKKFITKGYTSGGVDYVTKPVDPDIFILKVKTLHRLYDQNRELETARQTLLREVAVRKEAEAALNTRVQELRTILETLPQLAFTLRADGSLEFANEHWYVYSNDLAQMPQFHPDDAHLNTALSRSIKEGRPFVAETRIRNILTNSYRYHLLRIMPVRQDGSIAKWVGTFTDIQEQKTAEELLEAKVRERTRELERKNRELESSNHELQQFASVASHDLKEPLRKIQVFGSIMKERYMLSSTEAQDSINRVIESSQRMSRLINDLLDYSKLSAGDLFHLTDLDELLKEVLLDLDFAIREKRAVVVLEGLPIIEAIPGQLRQVFQNLISNSLKFAKADVPCLIEIKGQVTKSDGIDICCIEFRDNGIGFEPEYAEKIFTIFQRLNAREAYEGTGIGLAIVRKIIEKHQGTITATGTAGEGALFTIRLPVMQPKHNTEQTEYENLHK